MSQLGTALFTTTQQKVLSLMYGQPERSFYTKEILRLTGMGVATIKRELDRMLAAGILSMTKIGNQHHYQADASCIIYIELLSIVKKTFGVADIIKASLRAFDNNIELAFIYGSIAKGTESKSSDIDLMIVGNNLSYGSIMEELIILEESLQRSIHPTIYNPEELARKISAGNSFVTRVMERPKIMIKGAIDDFRKPS